MLTSIRIRNLALIDALEIRLDDGLSVLTGETGAGKSIIVGALNLILGDRATAETIRHGSDTAEVEALFEVSPQSPTAARLAEMGLSDGDGQLVVRRVLSRNGKNRVYLNQRLATLSHLKEVVGPMVDISSQHAHTSLLKVGEHRLILDRFGDAARQLADYEAAWTVWREAQRSLDALTEAATSRVERLDFLRFQLQEIEDVSPIEGEDVALMAERQRLQNATDLLEAARSAEQTLYSGNRSVCEQLTGLERELRQMGRADTDLAELAQRVEEARIELEDVGLEARRYQSHLAADPRRLADVEERLDALRRLLRKHGPGVTDVLARHDAMLEELEALDAFDERVAALQEDAAQHQQRALAAGRALTAARRRAGKLASARVCEQLADLGMADARFEVSITPLADLSPTGADRVEFLLSSNVGEVPRPLAKIASGGELSRIMLALKHVLAAADTVDCYVFDEVDTGVSGGIAERIGVKLRETAARRQALCITHLPQVASCADQHLRVHKEIAEGRTVTRVSELSSDERIEEMARLLAGVEVTEQARALARDMLHSAKAR